VKTLLLLPLVALCGCGLTIATAAQIATATVADVACGQAIDAAATSGELVRRSSLIRLSTRLRDCTQGQRSRYCRFRDRRVGRFEVSDAGGD